MIITTADRFLGHSLPEGLSISRFESFKQTPFYAAATGFSPPLSPNFKNLRIKAHSGSTDSISPILRVSLSRDEKDHDTIKSPRAENGPKERYHSRRSPLNGGTSCSSQGGNVAARAASRGPKASRKDRREEEEMSPHAEAPRLAHTTPIP